MTRPAALAAALFAVIAAILLVLAPTGARAADCSDTMRLVVPGAERLEAACLPDLSTRYLVATPYTDVSDWGALHSQQTRNPTVIVPGIQLDGYFPDTSISNTTRGWNHDAQFVIRLPHAWNGKLVVTGAPGVRKQYATDYLISDWVLSLGYAFAATDKGNTGTAFYNDGTVPGDAIVEWHHRVTELTVAAKDVVRQHYGRLPVYTYITGISNGGYLTRHALENRPDLYDGGVDWEGPHWRPEGPNLFTYLPAAIKHYPAYRAGNPAAHQAILDAGFAAGSEFLWDHHWAVYWDLSQRTYREEFDPGFDGAITGGIPFCLSGTPSCDADYHYASRPAEVHSAVGRVSLTGRIGKPMITLHGTLDSLLPISTNSDPYAQRVRNQGRAHLHRYYVVEGGNHVDQLYDVFPNLLRPIAPCWRTAFALLESWVEHKRKPPASRTIPMAGAIDPANACPI